jgi:enoyl-[acyl-carrier-protein] reductase (NADH)
VDEKGHEHILRLSVEDWWLADFESYYHLTSSRFNIEALEDMEILQISNTVVEEFIKPIPAFSSDLLNRKIRVNVITPGTTDTPAFEKFVPAEQIEGIKKHFASEMPIGRIGQPSDIGKTAVFRASDDSSFMPGAELLVDGGMTYLSKQ